MQNLAARSAFRPIQTTLLAKVLRLFFFHLSHVDRPNFGAVKLRVVKYENLNLSLCILFNLFLQQFIADLIITYFTVLVGFTIDRYLLPDNIANQLFSSFWKEKQTHKDLLKIANSKSKAVLEVRRNIAQKKREGGSFELKRGPPLKFPSLRAEGQLVFTESGARINLVSLYFIWMLMG